MQQKGDKTYTEAKYEGSEISRRLYRSAAEAARRLEERLRGASSFQAGLAPEVTQLRARLKDYCERLLFSAPLEFGRQAEELTWRKIYYDVVQLFKITKACAEGREGEKGEEERSLVELRAHLVSGLGHYHHLLLRLQAEAGLDLEAHVDVALRWTHHGLPKGGRWGQRRTAEDGSSPPRPKEEQPWARQSAHRFLIALGDLARYLSELRAGGKEHSRWAALSGRYYWQALALDPGAGMPHNQLGTLASGDPCKAAYHFLRCLQSSQPFEGAQGNLLRLFDKNSSQPSILAQQHDRCKPAALFTSNFLRLCEHFYTSSETNGLQMLCEETLSQLQSVLDQPEKEATVIFQAAVMAIICTDKLHKSGPHPLSSAAAAFTLNMFSHVAAACTRLVSQCLQPVPVSRKTSVNHQDPGCFAGVDVDMVLRRSSVDGALPLEFTNSTKTNGSLSMDSGIQNGLSSSESPPPSNASDEDTLLPPGLSRVGLLPCVKVLCDWLLGRADLIGPCTQARTPLWQHLSSLLNLLLPCLPAGYPTEVPLPDSAVLVPLPEDICLRGTAALCAAHARVNWGVKAPPGRHCQVRLSYLVHFGCWLSERPGSGLLFTQSQFQPKVPLLLNGTTPTLSNDALCSSPPSEEGGEDGRRRLMRSMAHLWLEQEVRDLEGQLGQGQALPPPFLVPHTQVLCARLVHVRRLVASRRFVLIVPSLVISSLDMLKRESVGARESIRWLEGELRRGSRYVRSQKSHERLSLSPMKYPKRKEKEAWELFQILECCHHLERQCPRGGHPADRPLVTLLVCSGLPPGGTTGLPSNAAAIASSAGISMEDVETFAAKWQSVSVPRMQPG